MRTKQDPEEDSGKGESKKMKISTVAAAVIFVLTELLHPCPTQAANTQTVIITMKSKSSAEAHSKVLQALGARLLHKIATSGNSSNEFLAFVARIPAGRLPHRVGQQAAAQHHKDVMNLLSGLPRGDVIDVEEDYATKWIEAMPTVGAVPFATMGAMMGGLPRLKLTSVAPKGMVDRTRPDIPWGVERMHAPAAWSTGAKGGGVRVGVIDTGIYTEHPNLAGQMNGGYDAFTKSESEGSYQDQNGHGTHVAGTIAATGKGGPKGFNVIGVAPEARLYAVRVLDAEGSGSIANIIDGLIWAANNQVQVVNMSLGSDHPSESLHRAIQYAAGQMIIVAAAGNSGGPVGYPAAYPETIAVGASDAEDHVASFSSHGGPGAQVAFIAPGVDVVSSTTRERGLFASWRGTSMATPHVTAAAALAMAQGWVGKGGPHGVETQLRKAAKPLADVDRIAQGAGMIDLGRLVRGF